MAKIIEFEVNKSNETVELLKSIGINLREVPNIGILGQAPITMTGLLAGINSEYIKRDNYGNPFLYIFEKRYSLAAVAFFIDNNGETWFDSMVRNNDELQNDTGLKKNDLKLAAVGWGLSSAPFKHSEADNKRKVVNHFVGEYIANETTDTIDDIAKIIMPIYCYQVETKPENAVKISDIIENESTSKMIAAKKSVLHYIENNEI